MRPKFGHLPSFIRIAVGNYLLSLGHVLKTELSQRDRLATFKCWKEDQNKRD